MNLFNLDCHISVIEDLKNIFQNLGHQVTSWSVSGHNWVFNRPAKNVDIVNQHTWMGLNDKMCDDFYNRYKDELSQYDAFIVTYPPAFAKIYEKFNKPTIVQVPIRYEVPYHGNPVEWQKMNNFYRNQIDKGLLIPVANSLYDKKYCEHFIEREFHLIPNICEYTNMKYHPENDKFLYYSRLKCGISDDLIVDKSKLGRFTWSDLSKYKGVIGIPYNCSTMSIFEYYTANIPLFFPSIDFMMELYDHNRGSVLSEITWNQVFRMNEGSSLSLGKFNDPNRYNDLNTMREWIQYSDFYNVEWMPHIIYFDSWEDLSLKLRETDLNLVSENMKNFNIVRKQRIYGKWKELLDKI